MTDQPETNEVAEVPAKPKAVALRHEKSGRTMRASQKAFDELYSGQGWVIVRDVEHAEPTAAGESEASDPPDSGQADSEESGQEAPEAPAATKARRSRPSK